MTMNYVAAVGGSTGSKSLSNLNFRGMGFGFLVTGLKRFRTETLYCRSCHLADSVKR